MPMFARARRVSMRADAIGRPPADGAPGDGTGGDGPPVDVSALVDGLDSTVLYRILVREDAGGVRERRVAYVSNNVERLFGLTPAAIREDVTRWYDLIVPADRERAHEARARAFRTGERLSVEARYAVPAGDGRPGNDGRPGGERSFALTASPTGRQVIDGVEWATWDGVLTDITDRVRRRAERERLTQIVEATADMVVTTDVAGRLTYINDAGRRFFGLDHRDTAATRRALTFSDALPERLHARYREHIIPAVLRDGVWAGETSVRAAGGGAAQDRDRGANGRERGASGRERVVSQVIVAHFGPDGRATHLSTILRDLSEREALERELRRLNIQSETLLGEVNHRVKNLFALLPAIVQLSARGRSDVNEVVAVVRERVTALARSHALTLDSAEGTAGIALDALVRAVLEPYGDRADKFAVDGPSVHLAMQDGNGLGLMLHELATNAAKHGALAQASGTVAISWSVEDAGGSSRLRLRWRERGLSGVAAPLGGTGFGTRLVDRLLEAQGGTVRRDWAGTGLTLDVDIPFYEARPADA